MKASVVAAVKANFFSSWFEICHLTHTTAGFMAWYCTARRLFIKKKLLQSKYIVQFASCTCSRCLAGNLIVNIVTPWFDLPVIWKAGPVFGLQISPTVFFSSSCQMEWKMEKIQKCFEDKRYIFAKVRVFVPPRYCSWFCIRSSGTESCVCVSNCACVCL